MTHVQDHRGATRDTRSAPTPHTAALQEAKRLEKMQTVCSSHRTSGTAARPVPPGKDIAT